MCIRDRSPDGKHIAFQSWRDRNYEIYVMDADGENPRNLTNHPFKDTEPSWSPDGRRIVFVSDREADANPDIFVMNADGSNPKNLTNHPEDDLAPAWFGSAFSVASAGKALTLLGSGQTGKPLTATVERTAFKDKKPI